jgi:hypothetical protein
LLPNKSILKPLLLSFLFLSVSFYKINIVPLFFQQQYHSERRTEKIIAAIITTTGIIIIVSSLSPLNNKQA